MSDEVLPSLPEPQDTAVEQPPDIEIERIDDTPEQDRGAAPPAPETYQAVHEERRQKEAAQREREALVGYAQNLQGEVAKLRELVSSGEKVLIDQSQSRA